MDVPREPRVSHTHYMKPGDFIEWVYKSNGRLVVEGEELWSTTLQKWVPIGRSNNLLISIHEENDKQVIMWLNDKGLFRACVDDTDSSRCSNGALKVVPRVRDTLRSRWTRQSWPVVPRSRIDDT